MDFSPTPEQEAIRAAVRQLCRAFDGAYWREMRRSENPTGRLLAAE